MAQLAIQQTFNLAVQHHQAGRLQEAEQLYRQILSQEPQQPDAMHLLGVIAHQVGRNDIAIDLIRQAIALRPDYAEAHGNLGNTLKDQGQLDAAIAAYRQAISLRPNFAEAHSNLGNALKDKGELDEAIAAYRNAVVLRPNLPEAHYNLANALADKGEIDDAIAAYRQAMAFRPAYAEAHYNLGLALRGVRRFDEAIAASRQAIAIKPNFPEAHNNLGNAQRDKGEIDNAVAAYRQALAFRPDYAEAHSNLGSLLRNKGQLDEAIAACRKAIVLNPGFSEAHNNLGNALRDKGQLDEAIASFRQAIALNPSFANAHNNLGNALRDKGQLDEALAAYRNALNLRPNLAEAHSNLGSVLRDKGQLDEAIDCYRTAIQLNPDFTESHHNLLYALHFHPGYDAQAILAEHRHWATLYAEPLAGEILIHSNDRSLDRKLKVGILSPDLRAHPVGHSLLPLLLHHDPRQLEIICYADLLQADTITAKLKALADQWRDVRGSSDQRLAELIRADGIDLLVDTTLHTAGGRLLVFAREPAPVQLTMLGPPTTTGLRTMHYRLTDPYLDPPGLSDSDYTETSIRLPHCFWCYSPPDNSPPPNNLPALTNGFVTFGCLNQFAKVTRQALELWLKILQSLPTARLMIQCQPGEHQNRVRNLFEAGGIESNRLRFVAKVPRDEYFRRYHELDLCLDPFPFNGHTSMMDALWMGVPTVALWGGTSVGRGGVSILSNVGLPELIAATPEDYIQIAITLAKALPKLADMRQTMRPRLQASPLLDGPGFTRNVEAAFRQAWQHWCANG